MRAVRAALSLLLLTSGASGVRPLWSWDTLQTFMHSSELKGLYPQAEAEVIAKRFQMVTIEKWQGSQSPPYANLHSLQGSTDSKIIAQCKQLKEINPKLSCIMYWDTNTVWDCKAAGPPGFCAGRQTDNIAYVGAITANLDPERYLLHQPDGSLYVSGYVNAHVLDFRKPAATALWIETCTNATDTGYVDGCFADFCSWGLPDADYPGFTDSHNAAVNALSAAMGDTGLAIGNNCRVLDPKNDANVTVSSRPSGVFIEGFGNNTASFSTLRAYVGNATAWPQKPLVQVHLGSRDCWDLLKGEPAYGCNNTFAAVMVLLDERVYIGLGNWRGDIAGRLLPEFSHRLGAPTGSAVIDRYGVYRRAFASGTRAWYDPATGLGSIDWGAAEQ